MFPFTLTYVVRAEDCVTGSGKFHSTCAPPVSTTTCRRGTVLPSDDWSRVSCTHGRSAARISGSLSMET
jgi:hypothetical protein